MPVGLQKPGTYLRRIPGVRSPLVATGIVLWFALAYLTLEPGISYYLTDNSERPFSTLHEAFRPAGMIGHGYGVIGTLMILVGVVGYSLRKRWSRLSQVGRLSTWLRVHIFLCTFGPFLVLLHTAFRVTGLVAISFWSMALVTASGFFGRYVYVRLPRTASDIEAGVGELSKKRAGLYREISVLTGAAFYDIQPLLQLQEQIDVRPFHALLDHIMLSVGKRRRAWQARRILREKMPGKERSREAVRAIRDYMDLQERINLLLPFQRLFRYWHAFHLPLAIVMFLIMLVHVGVAMAFGYNWIFSTP